MRIIGLLLFALEEVIVATSSLGSVSLLEVKWAREMGLVDRKAPIQEVAREIVASRLVARRYGLQVKEAPPELLRKAQKLGLPFSFSREFILRLLSLKAFIKERFGNNLENYRKWRDEELSREKFRMIYPISRLTFRLASKYY